MARVLSGRAAIAAAVLAVGGATWFAPRVASWRAGPTDYDVELRGLDARLEQLNKQPAPDPSANGDRIAAIAFGLYQRASLTNQADDFMSMRALVDRAMTLANAPAGLSLLRASAALRFHDLGAARDALRARPELAEDGDARLLAAEIKWQQGHYDAAAASYDEVLQQQRTWDVLARLAFVSAARGQTAEADRLYAEAEDEITAKEMRSYAWVEVQRGYLQFTHGRYDEARAHYRTADRAYSGYWLVNEYMAELLAAEHRYDEAIERYQRAVSHASRPDLLQQVGNVYLLMRRPREAAEWHRQALDGYLASLARGEMQYWHHLAGYYADVAGDGAEAVTWAARDADRRRNYLTDDALAWALYRAGRPGDASAVIRRALASGMADPHVYAHAVIIERAAGSPGEAEQLQSLLSQLNPRFADFHAHR